MFKVIASNTLAQVITKFVGAGLAFATTIIIIRQAGPTIYGDLTKSLVLIAVGFTLIDFGLNALGVRHLAHTKSPRDTLADILSTRLILSLLVVICLNLLVFLLPGGYSGGVRAVFWIGSLAVIAQGVSTSMNAYFQYRQNYWYPALAATLGAFVVASLTYYYTYHSPKLAHFLLAYSLGYTTSAAVALCLGQRVVGLTLDLSRIARLLRDSLTLGLILFASVFASKIDTIILGIFRTSAEVGQYGFSYRIFDVILVLPVFVMNALYPQLVQSSQAQITRYIRTSLLSLFLLGGLFATATYLAAPWILVIRPELTLSVTALRLLSVSTPLFFLTAPLMWGLIARRQERVVLVAYLASALFSLALNLVLVPSLGVPGAALGTGLTELFIFCILYLSTRQTQTTHA